MIVPGNGGGRGGGSKLTTFPDGLGCVLSLFKRRPLPKLNTKAVPE